MRAAVIIIGCLIVLQSYSQGAVQLTLQQALEMAAKQSYSVQTNALELEKAQKRMNEIRGMGLPQINGTAGFQDFLDIPVQVAPDFFGGSDQLVELQFGLQYSGSAGVQIDQLIFDGSYLVGLKAARAYNDNKVQELEQTMLDAKAAAAKAYYAVLVADEAVNNLESLVPVLEENLRQVTGLTQNGFADATDKDRIELSLSEVQNQLLQMKDQRSSALDMLHFVLGMPVASPLELADELDFLVSNPDPRGLAGTAFEPASHIDSKVASSLLVMQELAVKNQRSQAYPKLYGFFNHTQNAYRREFDIFGSGPWYPTTVLGVNLQIPIFSGGSRVNQLKQEQLTLEQVRINQHVVDEQLLLDYQQKKNAVLTNADRYDNAKANLNLAQRIFDRTNSKFKEGLASSFELNEERSQLINSQNAYIQSLADLLLARADLREALGIF